MDGMGLSASLLQPVQEKKKEEKKYEAPREKQGKNLLEDVAYLKADGEIPVPFGKTEEGKIVVHDIHDVPHMVVCGYTGAGKTAFIQTMLATIVSKTSSKKIGFVIFDSKHVEYLPFQSAPHLCLPIISDPNKAISTINYYAAEAKTRLQAFASCGKKELAGYNFYCERMGKEGFQEVFIVLDDFSTIKADKDTIMNVLDILRNGRIVGIHLIIVSSVATAKVLQKDLLSNIPCRISFCLSSKAESKIVLEEGGAENLFVPGEMIVKLPGSIEKCQSAHATEDNITKVVRQIKADSTKNVISLGNAAAGLFTEKFISTAFDGNSNKQNTINNTQEAPQEDSFDIYVPRAGQIIIEKGRASIGLLQRELKIGFNWASRIMDQLEELGVVGEEQGTTPRKLLMTMDEWKDVCQKHGWVINESPRNLGASLGRDVLRTLYKDGQPSYGNIGKSVGKASGSSLQSSINGQFKSDYLKNRDSDTSKDDEEDKYERIPLRDFPDVQVGESTIGVNDNLIKYTVPIMTRLGKGTATPSFNGSMVEKIIYKKPTFTQKGYLTFTFPPDIKISNDNPYLFTATSENISDVIKIEFDKNDAKILWLVAKQISEDIQVPITVL